MKPTQDKYPHFEANQVLTNSHLNQIFDYLDEQNRLTRANLIGIGIVCGLEFKTETNNGSISIQVSRGVGVGSAGYLLNQPEHVTLVSYREYTLPNEVDYPNFKFDDGGLMKQYPLWELFAAGEPNTFPLNSPAGFLNDKALILFLELKMEGLRNCSPNDCNDKGEEVTATLRHLLIRIADLEKIIAAASDLPGNFSLADLEQSFTGRLNLPDIRMPRWDVEASTPVTSVDVLKGFHRAFSLDKTSDLTGKALSAAYQAFKPLVSSEFPSDPFAGFASRFGFLDNTDIPAEHLKFIQYYHGFFEDLLNAYDEFRWKGIRMMCACAPPEDLFPRHLMLGVINPSTVNNPELFRNHFMPSPAISNCEDQIRELRQLFARLVEMIVKFTHTPPLPQSGQENRLVQNIRITPDKLADVSLSEKAIPYYYLQSGPNHLFRLWNYERTQRGRANQNLSYRSDEFIPVAPNFVLNPMRFDLEPYNFLRIEGHLGQNYQAAISSLLAQKNRFRLPIDVIALRTGLFDEQNLNVRNEGSCHFNDLEAQYDSRVAELIGFLGGNLKFFYDLFFEAAKGLIDAPIPSIVPWFVAWDPDFRVKPTTLGAYLEKQIFNNQLTAPYFDPDNIAPNLFQFIAGSTESQKELILFYIGYYIARFPDVLPADLTELDLDALNNREKDITRVAEAIEFKHEQFFGEGEQRESVVKWEDLDDRLEALVYGHYSDSIKALLKEYQRRLKEFNKLQYLSHYLRKNPGIQHKAGVPVGGTFILVYHGDERSKEDNISPITGNFIIRGQVVVQNRQPLPGAFILVKETNRGASTDFFGNFVLRTSILPVTLRVVLVGFSPVEKVVRKEGFVLIDLLSGSDKGDPDISSDFFPGEVIADFYLPYLCCSDCAPVQFVLPLVPPTFNPEIGCTDVEGNAKVILKPVGGSPPYRLKINEGNFTEIGETVTLQPGEFTLVIQDASGVESAPQTITIAEPLISGEPNFDCTGDNNEYVAVIEISGGTPPYSSNIGEIINEKTFFAENLAGDTDHEVIIKDSRGCTVSVIIHHSCSPDLSFHTRIGCSNADNFAPVEIIVSGGIAPYEVQVDSGEFEALAGPIHLSAGKHTLVVRDASGTQTPQQEIEIFGRIELGRPDFDCIGENNEYVVVIRIIGGTQPYTSNIGRIIDRQTFISDALAGETDHEVIIQDSRGCTVSVIVNHSCIPDLNFRTIIGCSNADNFAPVEIIVSGGTAPYEVQVDNGDFEALVSPIHLPVGKHTLVLRDASETITPSQEIEIPGRIELGRPNFDCIGENNEYVVDIRISGGTPPYTSNIGRIIDARTFISDALAGDSDHEVIISDSRGCTASIIVNHSCLESINLNFETSISCTSSDGSSLVEIFPAGGTAPYSIQIGTAPFQPLDGPITISVGNHQITLQDANLNTGSKSISIPPALTLEVLEYFCEPEKNSYQAKIRINGGTGPYHLFDGTPVSENEFTTDPFPSGEKVSINIRDNNKCEAFIDLEHTCDEPCDLPCEGETLECAYRLWLQPPTKTQQYEVYQQMSEVTFRFNDKLISLPDSDQLLQISTEDLNNDFDNAIGGVVKNLNIAIDQALRKEHGNKGNNRIVLSYNPQETDPFSVLRIEHFVCETFNIEFNYKYAMPEPGFNLNVKYTNELQNEGIPFIGAVFNNPGLDNKQMIVPAFDCSKRNICSDTSFEKICQDNNLKPDFVVEPLGRIGFQLQNTTPGNNQAAWVWDIFGTFPAEPFYEGENVRILISKPSGFVRLTVITTKGCFAFTEKDLKR